jgi:signal transduction histidine kinase
VGFTLALLVIVLGLILLVDLLHDRAALQRKAQLVASELQQDAAELVVAEETLRSGVKAEEVGEEIDEEFVDLYATVDELRSLSDAGVLPRVRDALTAVEAALASQLSTALAGDLAAAREVGESEAVPALDRLDEQVTAATDHYESAASRADRIADLGLWVALITAGVAIVGLSWRHERLRRVGRRQMELRLRERVAEVAEISERHRKLEAMKYSFVTAVSHELRTPLTAIHGSLEMLEDGDYGPLDDRVLGVVSVAGRGTRRLARLVEDIIDLERLESGVFGFEQGEHRLRPLLLEGTESLMPLAKDARVSLRLGDQDATVACDADRVLQAVVNLVGNAIKFTAPGGTIHLDIRSACDEVEVTVRDEGRGIPATELEAVFDRFHQVDGAADQAKGGTGLGLTITRHIIEGQGGRVWVESEVGHGTTFHFTLPSPAGV